MLELIGRGYVIQHCVALLKKERVEKIYRNYITDGLKAISETLVNMSAKGGASLSVRYAELVDFTPKGKEENAEDIIKRIKRKLTEGGDDGDAV